MACFGLGIDIVDVEKFSRILEKRGMRLLERVFTPEERRYCDQKTSRGQSYSARFAAKEAFLKALGEGLRGGLRWRDIEVTIDHLGKPGLNLSGRARELTESRGVRRSFLSMSHAADSALAVVLLED